MAVLNVAGGRVAFLGDNPGMRPIYTSFLADAGAARRSTSPDFEVFIQRMLELGQQALDPADPLDYARRWRREPFAGFAPRRVLIRKASATSWSATRAPKRWPPPAACAAHQPMADVEGVSGLWRFDPPGGHSIFGRTDVREQAFRFLASGGTVIVAPV